MAGRAREVIGVLAFAILTSVPTIAGADPAQPHATAATVNNPTVSFPTNPREAGARYGQAAGVALVCYGMITKPTVDDLKAHYTGDDLAAFDDQAKLILDSWKQLLSCKHATGPNECKISQGKSCYEANLEIGMTGTKLPGLIDAKPEKAAAAPAAAP